MAKESTIRTKAKEKLTRMGYVVSVPHRSRFGSFTTTFPDGTYKQGDDLFLIFDLVGWKGKEMIFLQYTSTNNVADRKKKIEDMLKKQSLQIPQGTRIEVWGYKNGDGFTRQIIIKNV